MSKPVGENTVAFRRGEAGHGLEAARKGGIRPWKRRHQFPPKR